MHIIPDLRIGFRCIGFFTRRTLQLHQHDWQAIQEKKHIRTLIAVFNKSPLVGNNEGVVVRVLIVNQINQSRTFFTSDKKAHFNTMLDVVHKHSILLNQIGIVEIFQLK